MKSAVSEYSVFLNMSDETSRVREVNAEALEQLSYECYKPSLFISLDRAMLAGLESVDMDIVPRLAGWVKDILFVSAPYRSSESDLLYFTDGLVIGSHQVGRAWRYEGAYSRVVLDLYEQDEVAEAIISCVNTMLISQRLEPLRQTGDIEVILLAHEFVE